MRSYPDQYPRFSNPPELSPSLVLFFLPSPLFSPFPLFFSPYLFPFLSLSLFFLSPLTPCSFSFCYFPFLSFLLLCLWACVCEILDKTGRWWQAMAPNSISLPWALAFPPPSYRDTTTPSPCCNKWPLLDCNLLHLLGPSFHDPRTHHVLKSHPKRAAPLPTATMSDDMLSALTLPLHYASILQPATPPSVVPFESWTISAPICLNPFTLAETRKPDLWTCEWVLTFFSSAFAAFLIGMKFSFKSLFAIWSLSPQRFHYYFCLSKVSWQYQSTILILVLCLLCVTPLVCWSCSSFAPSSPFFSSW